MRKTNEENKILVKLVKKNDRYYFYDTDGTGYYKSLGIYKTIKRVTEIINGTATNNYGQITPIALAYNIAFECINKEGFAWCSRFNSNFPKLEKICEQGLYCTKIREITDSNFPKLKTIGYISFGNFNGINFLKKIDSNSIETIESYAFAYCYNLESIKMNSVKSIGEYAFESCYSLQSVELQNCEHIDNGAFSECYMLQTADVRKTDNVNIFSDCTDLKKLIVPSGIEFDKVSLFGYFMYLDIQYV